MKIVYDFPIILIKNSDAGTALRKTWVVKKGAIWILPDDAILLFPPKKDKDANS